MTDMDCWSGNMSKKKLIWLKGIQEGFTEQHLIRSWDLAWDQGSCPRERTGPRRNWNVDRFYPRSPWLMVVRGTLELNIMWLVCPDASFQTLSIFWAPWHGVVLSYEKTHAWSVCLSCSHNELSRTFSFSAPRCTGISKEQSLLWEKHLLFPMVTIISCSGSWKLRHFDVHVEEVKCK